MATIDPASKLASLIRSQVGAMRTRAGSLLPSPPRGSTKQPDARGVSDVASLVAHRVKGIDPSDPDRRRKAFRIFLEAVLISELGNNVASDPEFVVMADAVQARMEADPDAAQVAAQAAEIVLKHAAR